MKKCTGLIKQHGANIYIWRYDEKNKKRWTGKNYEYEWEKIRERA
jgi:hypothetical protein